MTQVITKAIQVRLKTIRTAIDVGGYRYLERQVSGSTSIPRFLKSLVFMDWQFFTTYGKPAPQRVALIVPTALARVHPVFFQVEPYLHAYLGKIITSGRYPSMSAFCSSLVADHQMEYCNAAFSRLMGGMTMQRSDLATVYAQRAKERPDPATYSMAPA